MPPFLRMTMLGAGLLAASAALAATPVSVPPVGGSSAVDRAREAAMQDALVCAAAVLSYQPNAAEPACGRLIALLPDEPLGYKFRGLAYLLEHRYEQAEADFHTAVRLDPGDAENQAGYAQAMAGQGRFAEAIPRFETALRLAPKDIRYLAASCWARAGEGSRLDLALRDCNRALALSPQFATALQNRGLVRLKQKNWRLAIQDYSRALAYDGDRPTALFGRGFAELQTDEAAKAHADILAARQIDPEIDDLYILQKVLPAGCRDASAPCPLPNDLRNPMPSRRPPLWMASYHTAPFGHPSGLEDFDETVRTVELGRLDAMLDRTATLLGTTLGPAFIAGWQDAELPSAWQHLAAVRQEYRRLQHLACSRKLVGGDLCRIPRFGKVAATDSAALRGEIDHTIALVHPFWRAVCHAVPSPEPCGLE